MKNLANELIKTVEFLELEFRCGFYGDSWNETKEQLLKEAEEGVMSYHFWDLVNNITNEIKYFTK